MLFGLAVVGLLAGYFFALTRPEYFSNADYLGALVLAELVIVSLWFYETIFYPLLMFFFLWAGLEVPFSSVGTAGRWLVLVVAAFAGFPMWMRHARQAYNAFHLVALCCVATALVSALVSADQRTSLLKVLSLFLLFLYGSTGARLAILGRESQFVRGLLIACEITVYASAVSYLGLGISLWGNPNSLGAVMGVVMVPVLLWGVMVAETRIQRYRRLMALLIAGILLYMSLSRASILAAVVAVGILCFCLRRQRLLWQGTILSIVFLSAAAMLNPNHFENLMSSFTSDVLYKGKTEQGLLGSRLSPWQETVQVIKERPWFGTGFGTSYMGENAPLRALDPSISSGALRTGSGSNREHGNSYLALTEYVGLVGSFPFAILVFLVMRMVFQVCSWMRRSSTPYHCAIPLAMVLLAGLIHAFFEDWLTAVGYYLCVFFWTSAFMMRDIIPARQAIRVSSEYTEHPGAAHPYAAVTPNR